MTGLVDVDNPLCGPHGASATYGPQKGADADAVWELDRALEQLAATVAHDLGVDRAREPGAGAAGGLGYGLLAFAGARLRPGVEAVAEIVGLDAALRASDLVITGEGAFDATSLRGKVVGGVLDAARRAGVRRRGLRPRERRPEGVEVVSLVEVAGEVAAMRETRPWLERVGERLASGVPV